jgi:hypothetical protein
MNEGWCWLWSYLVEDVRTRMHEAALFYESQSARYGLPQRAAPYSHHQHCPHGKDFFNMRSSPLSNLHEHIIKG